MMDNSPNIEKAAAAGWGKTNDKCLFITLFHSFLIFGLRIELEGLRYE